MKKGVNPFQQKLYRVHPSLESQVQKELKKLLYAKIIFQVWHFAWVANLIIVRKKNNEIHLYVDFKILNKASKKDN